MTKLHETGLRLYDTAAGRVLPLEPRLAGHVSMYVCGPTVDNAPHVGHGRMALVFDVLRRHLQWSGFEVDHVSNITDIDDKIIARAKLEGRSPEQVAGHYEKAWWRAMDAMGVARPTRTPRATEWVDEMIALVSELLERDVAYVTDDGVYMEVGRVVGYGLLARQSLESLRSGARVEVVEEKRSPLDFALWKKAKPDEPVWDAPFGPGRPGWHTECVVMSLGLLGEGFDIHGGGADLAFPHHENERAQALALGRVFASRWVHNGFVVVDGEKMSKSLGNFTTLTELLEHADPRSYRLLVLRSHYRRPIDVTPETVEDAARALERLDALARRFGGAPSEASSFASALALGADPAPVSKFISNMDDDLDTPGALGVIFDLVTKAHSAGDAGDDEGARRLAMTAIVLARSMGLELSNGFSELPTEVVALAAERDNARARKDWASADAVRSRLQDLGWHVEDGPEGTQLHR